MKKKGLGEWYFSLFGIMIILIGFGGIAWYLILIADLHLWKSLYPGSSILEILFGSVATIVLGITTTIVGYLIYHNEDKAMICVRKKW